MNKISVIVPVYNAAKTIETCIESILNQTVSVFEIVLVNDGSKDNSEQVIKKYQEKYENIKYYYKENSGVADTRNYGIEKATGEYILFIDSDDYIEKDLIEKCNTYVEQNIELIKYKLKRVNEKGEITEKVDGPVFECVTGEEAFNSLYYQDVLLDSPCVYIMKKDLFKNNKFKGTYHEDFGLIPLIVVMAKTVVSLPDYFYNYVQVGNSITRNEDYSKTIKKMEQVLFQYDNMIKTIEKLKKTDKTKENVKIYYTNAIIMKLKELNNDDRKKFVKELKARKMFKNLKIRNPKQLLKRIVLKANVNLYLKMR